MRNLRKWRLDNFLPANHINLKGVFSMKGFRKETLVITDGGIVALEEIGDINGSGTQPISVQIAHDAGKEEATEFLISGPKTIGTVTMETGAVLDVFGNHELKVYKSDGVQWLRIQDLAVDNIVPYRIGGYSNLENYVSFDPPGGALGGGIGGAGAAPPSVPYKEPTTLDEDAAWVLGAYFANGSSILNGDGIAVSGQLAFLSRFIHMIDALFNISSRLSRDPAPNYIKTKYRTGTVEIESTNLINFLDRNGLLRSDNINQVQIPIKVRRSPISVIRNFIEGFHISTAGSTLGFVKELRTRSFKMAQQLLYVLRAIGNDSRMFIQQVDDDGDGTPDAIEYLIEYDLEQIERDSKKNRFNMLPDKIISIQAGVMDCYDLTVPANNLYLANSYSGRNVIA